MDGLIHRYRHASTQCRFPLYGSASPDSCPDFDHFGSGSTALQRMLLQEAAGKILLLPAWPADWDANFKLHLEGQTVVSGIVKDGVLQSWDITPASRKKDVVVHKPQVAPVRPLVTANKHPLRVGKDSTGSNLFKGEFGRVTMFKRVLTDDEAKGFASGSRDSAVTGKGVAFSVLNPELGGTLTDDQSLFAGEFSFEMWIKPSKGDKGRLLDKLTAGADDGFLIDCHPGESLRVITTDGAKVHQGGLTFGKWHHVAVVFGKRSVTIYLNGVKL